MTMKTAIFALTLALLTPVAGSAARASPCTSLRPRCTVAPTTANPDAVTPECKSPDAYAAWVAREQACQAAAAAAPIAATARPAPPIPPPPTIAPHQH